MTLADLGLRPIALGTRVFFTHRATSVKAVKRGETWYSGEARDLTSADRHRHYGEGGGPHAEFWKHPSQGWPAPRRLAHLWSGKKPQRLDRWVAVWPEQGVGWVIGLAYRCEGTIHFYSGEDGGNEFDQVEKIPLYQVRTHLNGAILLVPPFACVPLDERVITFGDNLPAAVGFEKWDDYVADTLTRLSRQRENIAA